MSDQKIIQALESQGLENPTNQDIDKFKEYLNEIAELDTLNWAKLVNNVGHTEYRNGKPYQPNAQEIANSFGGRNMEKVFLNRYHELYK